MSVGGVGGQPVECETRDNIQPVCVKVEIAIKKRPEHLHTLLPCVPQLGQRLDDGHIQLMRILTNVGEKGAVNFIVSHHTFRREQDERQTFLATRLARITSSSRT